MTVFTGACAAIPESPMTLATMPHRTEKETKAEVYVERVPIPLDQPTIAWLAFLERTTGEPAAQIAGRFLSECRQEFGRVGGTRLN